MLKLFKKKKKIIIYDDGSRYEGTFKDGSKNIGTMYFNNNSKFEGSWNDDKLHKGIYYYEDGSKYEGSFKDNEKVEGIFYFNNGNRYEGSYKYNGMFDIGTFYFNNGNRYSGSFNNDKMDGIGTYSTNIGSKLFVLRGIFKDNKLVEVINHTIPLLDPSIKYMKVGDGIHLVAYYKNIHNKQILLLGEYHNDLLKCTNGTNNTLLQWFRNFKWPKDECLDLFVEDYFTTFKYNEWFRGIPKYASEVSKHVKNFRYHYIDYRLINDNIYDFSNYYLNYFEKINDIIPIINNYK